MVLCFREIELAKKMKSCLSVASFFFFLRLVQPWNVSLRYFFSSHVQLLRAFGCDEKYPKLFLFHFKKWTAQKIYKSKYIPAQTTFRQQKDKLNYIYKVSRQSLFFSLSLLSNFFLRNNNNQLWKGGFVCVFVCCVS